MLTVFSFGVKPNNCYRTGRWFDDDAERCHIMVGVEAEPDDFSMGVLLGIFDIEEPLPLPSILFFQVAENRHIDTFLVKLEQERVEESFIEIKQIVSLVAESLKELPDNAHSHNQYIFDVLTQKLRDRKLGLFIKKGVKKANDGSGIASIILGLAGG